MASLFVGLVWGALTAKGNNHFPNFFSGTQNHDKQVVFFFGGGEAVHNTCSSRMEQAHFPYNC